MEGWRSPEDRVLERLALRADRSDWRTEAILARLALLDVDGGETA